MTNKPRIPLVYIAGRFRGPMLADVDRNIVIASMFVAPIAQAGAFPLCVHLSEGLRAHDLQSANNGQWWVEATLEVLDRCDAVVVVPGWEDSAGTQGEVYRAQALGLPVFEATWAGATVPIYAMPIPASIDDWNEIAEVNELGQATWGDQSFFDWIEAWWTGELEVMV